MKTTFFTLALALFIFTSCEGPQGPPGPQGPSGVNILGQTFEIDNVDFQYDAGSNLHVALLSIPTTVEVFESDAILVYRLDQVVSDGQGGTADAWSLIPQNFFLGNGDIIQYVYNHTFFDMELLIDGNFDLSTLSNSFTQDQVFRFVVVPSDFGTTSGVDISDLDAVMEALQLD